MAAIAQALFPLLHTLSHLSAAPLPPPLPLSPESCSLLHGLPVTLSTSQTSPGRVVGGLSVSCSQPQAPTGQQLIPISSTHTGHPAPGSSPTWILSPH